MPLQIDAENLRRLMEDFYVLSGVRMVLFDESEREVLSYPEQGLPFCREMRKDPEFLRLCRTCDGSAFRRCRAEGKLTVYRCHAGLFEAAAPLCENGEIIGYLMFGQVACGTTRSVVTRELTAIAQSFGVGVAPALIRSVSIRSHRQIRAAAKILEACTGYIRLQDLAVSRRDELMHRLEKYVESHLSEDCSVDRLCQVLSVSRSSLYRLFPSDRGGVADFVRKTRIRVALELFRTTDLSTGEIAHRVGFTDEQYFRRLFRRTTGVGVGQVRKKKDNKAKFSQNS